jgi:hypothetical protein
MRTSIHCMLPLALAAFAASPASAWERFVAGGPGWVQDLAPRAALSPAAQGAICVMTNDRVYGAAGFSHVLSIDAQNVVQSHQLLSVQGGLVTLGVDCGAGAPVAAYAAVDPAPERHTWLTGYFADGSGPWRTDLPATAAVRPSRFAVSSAQRTIVLREKAGGASWDLAAYDGFQPFPSWQAPLDAWRFPGARVLDMRVAADGSTALLGSYDRGVDAGLGVFVQRFDANGAAQFATDVPDAWAGEVGPAALAPAGTAWFVRKDPQLQQDALWRVPPPSPAPMPVDVCCGPGEVVALATTPDDGALVARRASFGAAPRLLRFAADGTALSQADVWELDGPGFDLLGLVGDRAGRSLVVIAMPAFPPSTARVLRLHAYDAQGFEQWTRDVAGARLDTASPLQLALTSDDRVVFALDAVDASGTPGILVQAFALDTGSIWP